MFAHLGPFFNALQVVRAPINRATPYSVVAPSKLKSPSEFGSKWCYCSESASLLFGAPEGAGHLSPSIADNARR